MCRIMPSSYLFVKVHPNAKKEALIQNAPSRFEAWIKPKPIEGRANDALLALLGRGLNVSTNRIKLVKGGLGRNKVFQVI